MDREHIRERLRIQPATQTFGLKLAEQRHTDTADDVVVSRVSLKNLNAAGKFCFRRRFHNQQWIDVQRKMLGVALERSLMFESGGQHANVSTRRSEEHTSELQSLANIVCRL